MNYPIPNQNIVGGERPKPRNIQEMVKQNQQFVAEKSSRNRDSPSPAVQVQTNIQVDLKSYIGHERLLVDKYLDTDLLDKESFESKQARFQMGLGMIEIRPYYKQTNCLTFRDHIAWYKKMLV